LARRRVEGDDPCHPLAFRNLRIHCLPGREGQGPVRGGAARQFGDDCRLGR
jgi:hypothetical protein